MCRASGLRILAINDSHAIAPFADALYACDGRWWDHHKGVSSFPGLKFGMTVKPAKWPDVHRLSNTGGQGFEPIPGGLRTGGNGGFQAVQLAVHLGAVRILLLGFDMKPGKKGRTHFFGEHPPPIRSVSNYATFCAMFKSLVKPLRELGIEVINCSRDSVLTAFPRMSLEDALAVPLRATA